MKKTGKQLNSKNSRKKTKLTPVPKKKYKNFKANFYEDEADFNFESKKYKKSIIDEDFDLEDEEDDFPKAFKKRTKQVNFEEDFEEDDNFSESD